MEFRKTVARQVIVSDKTTLPVSRQVLAQFHGPTKYTGQPFL